MVDVGNWTILGSNELAGHMAAAAPYVELDRATTVVTSRQERPAGAIATGSGVLHGVAGDVIPDLLGFRVLEETARLVYAGETGKPYGCFGSYRLGRDTSPKEVRDEALLPLVAYATLLFPNEVDRVWAKNASLFHDYDAWFVTIRLRDGVILTLEAMPTARDAALPELLIEVTGSERLLRAEPMRQSVTVERLDGPDHGYPWWEDRAERLLRLIRSGEFVRDAGSRLRHICFAIQQSSQSGSPVTL